ncbi:WD40/YVTN/BNR-like repeat-containing protein [Ruminiclostridium josui]|uniref:WD40/YVTN/BNR-like repeat-containing protein n=1 Tax=Ruminiclostridium josui TaxID=1499 RepID=UPI000B2F0D05|nr:hypothetical protein [Ruminiclostridium josui]
MKKHLVILLVMCMLFTSCFSMLVIQAEGFEDLPAPQDRYLWSIAANDNGLFAAVGDYGIIRLTENGVDWKDIQLPIDSQLNSVASRGTQFVAVGDLGAIYTSEEGYDWKEVMPPKFDYNLTSVVSNGKVFVAAGSNGAILYSEDGYKWVKAEKVFASYKESVSNVTSLVWNGNIFYSITDIGTSLISENGFVWKEQKIILKLSLNLDFY